MISCIRRVFGIALLIMFALPIHAYDFKEGYLCYNINSDGVSVTSENPNLNTRYSNMVDDLEIPHHVTHAGITYEVNAIEHYAFCNVSNLKSVKIPATVKSIGYYAFQGCTDLTSISIPDSLAKIGYDCFQKTSWLDQQPDGLVYLNNVAIVYKGEKSNTAIVTLREGTLGIAGRCFSYCSLKGVELPNSLKYIGSYAFERCGNLTTISLGDSIEEIDSGAFYSCTSLSVINVPESLKFVGQGAFNNTSWFNSQPDGLTYIGRVAYTYKGTPSGMVTIKEGTVSISPYCFYECERLTGISIPSTVSEICDLAFYYCTGLRSVTLPNSVIKVNSYAFYNCSALESVELSTSLGAIGNSSFAMCKNLKSVTIPNSVVVIGKSAFSGCEALSELDIPNSVIFIGSNAFKSCNHIRSLFLGNQVTEIGESAFNGCSSITNVDIPNSVIKIGKDAFLNCSNIKGLTLGSSLRLIDDNAFSGCQKIKNLYIPSSVDSIGHCAFADCSSLESIEVESGNVKYDSRDNCNALISTSNNILLKGCLSSIIPDGIKEIDDYAFSCCGSFTNLELSPSVTRIGDQAFYACTDLTSVTISEGLKSMGSRAFWGCSKLTSVAWNAIECADLSDQSAFRNFSKITSFTFGGNVKRIPANLCYGLRGLKEIELPPTVTENSRKSVLWLRRFGKYCFIEGTFNN